MDIKEEVKKYFKEREQKIILTDNQILAEMEYILDDIYALGDEYYVTHDMDLETFKREVEHKMALYLEMATYLKK